MFGYISNDYIDLKIELKKLYNASPAINPAAAVYIAYRESGTLIFKIITLINKPDNTIKLELGLTSSKPVANSIPICLLGPPINCSNAPGIAHKIIAQATELSAPASIVVAKT